MSFITYAQNGEDVLLWRALGHIANGFYIDVGANDPELHSVTKAFYDAGWRGINIEPMPSYAAAFLEQRPRDINLAVAAGAEESSITLFDVPSVNGWASTDAEVAQAHRAEGYELVEQQVPLRTLNAICAEHVQGEIHFLKIDVEGFEGEVLRGVDLQRWRPWVLVIEATMPNSRVTNHEQWEHLVTPHGYRFAWFDGLNRYYVAQEHAGLLDALQLQPNVFDDYLPTALVKSWDHGKAETARADRATRDSWDANARLEAMTEQEEQQRLRAETAEAESARLAELERQLRTDLAASTTSAAQADAWGRDMEQRLLATFASTSWRVTRPLRMASSAAQLLRARLRSGSRGLLRRTVSWLTSRQWLRRLLLPLLAKVPSLDAAVTQAVTRVKQAPEPDAPDATRQQSVAPELQNLSAATRRVLADLERARPNPESE